MTGLVPWLAVLLSGCVVSIDPVVPESDAQVDPRLLGTWEEVDGSDRVVISRAAENDYAIEYTSEGEVSRFDARLGRLGERMVLDVWPAMGDADLPEPHAVLLVAGHLLHALEIGSDEIRVGTLDRDSLLAALRAGQVRLAHSLSGDQLILRGSTQELRAELVRYLSRPGVFAEPAVFRRAGGAGRGGPPGPVAVPCFEASAWRDADALFRRDPHWAGGDAASSVELGDGRILWLFGDSWIDPSGRGTRQGARMVSNSVAIQEGTDPAGARMRAYWGRAPDGSPTAFIPDEGDERHWFGNGVRVGDRLVLFLGRIRNTGTGLGFEPVGWTAWMVENPESEPSMWRMRRLVTSTNPLGVAPGFAAVVRLDDYVVALGAADAVGSQPVYAVRWPAERVHEGNLLHPEWWAGDRLGWVPDSSNVPRRPLFEPGQSELSIHIDETTGRFLVVQTQGFGPADVMMRAAPALTGPWSAPQLVHRPPEYYRPNVMIYSAKAHPELSGGDLVLTYATNTFRFAEQLSDSLIYYPRFLRLARCGQEPR